MPITYVIRLKCRKCRGARFYVRAAKDGHVGAFCVRCREHYELICPDTGFLFDATDIDAYLERMERRRKFRVVKGGKDK